MAYILAFITAAMGLNLPWWIDAPGLFGAFGLVWAAYDSHGWKIRRLSTVPNFSGTWDGHVASSYQAGTRKAATLTIRQTATRIQVHLRTDISQSCSTMALVTTGGDGSDELHYSYNNRPGTAAEESMRQHDGWADLRLVRQQGEVVLMGDYESNRHRKTHGQMLFRRS